MNAHFKIAGRRPHKLLPTDEAFARELLETVQNSFNRTLPENVCQELNNDEYSRIINLYTGFITDYKDHKLALQKKGNII